jgi:bifunctional DNA-binding transcriptional regulator/antitoxin component of YhaV-PrlF toxin-antitoxin module
VIEMNSKSKTITLRRRGTLTLPADLRKKYRLEEGEPLTLLDLGGIFVIAPKVSMVPKLVEELTELREEAGLQVEDLLEGLDEERRKLYKERYGF